MSHSDSEADPLVALAEEFAARYRRGERPSLTEYTDRYPEQAERIRRLFPAMVVIEQLGSVEGQESGPSDRAVADRGHAPQRLGDYRILREVGRGGMGVVYEAEQVSLGRRVALKVLPRPAAGDAKPLARFLREARSAAKLHHTNIVPVFEVGQDGDVGYYAMQFIQGQGLDQVIEELRRLRGPLRTPDVASPGPPAPVGGADGKANGPSPSGTVSQVTRSLLTGWSQAGPIDGRPTIPGMAPGPITTRTEEVIPEPSVQATASRPTEPGGPSTPAPDSPRRASAVLPGGTVLSGDGLGGRHQLHRAVARIGQQVAEALGHAHARGIVHRDIKPSNLLLDAAGIVWITDFGLAKAEEDGLTNTGDVLGTLRYMAPERFRGEGDGRADLYALGLTLYELLTLRPAFDSSDRLRLIELVKNREPVRPRTLDPRIPRDLETIVLKAIAKDPKRRYQTADELAEDLRRFLGDEPIRARQVGVLGRAALWAKRRPAEAALALVGSLAALALIGVGVSLWYSDRLQAALDDARRFRYFQLIALANSAWRDGNMGFLEQHLDTCPAEYQHHWEWRYLKRQCHVDLHTFAGHRGGVYRLDYSRDGARLASASLDGTVKLWDTATGRLLRTFEGHGYDVFGVAFSPDGTSLASTGADGTVRIWDAATGRSVLARGPSRIFGWKVSFSPDGARLATSDSDGSVRLWDAKSGGQVPGLRVEDAHKGEALNVVFAPDGKIIASAGADRAVKLWDVTTGRVVRTLDGPSVHGDIVYGVAFSPDGRLLATAGADRLVKLWDVASGRFLRNLEGHVAEVSAVAFSPDGRWLASGSGDPSIKVWDVATGRKSFTIRGHAALVFDVAFSPDGTRLASASQDGTVKLWDAVTDPMARVFGGHTGAINAVAFHPRERVLASAGQDGTVRLWDVASDRATRPLSGHGEPVISVAFSPGGELLASADRGGTVRLWDTARRGMVGPPLSHPGGEVSAVAFHPDGRRLATAGGDGTVRIWEVKTGRPAGTYRGHSRSVRSLAFSPDGELLASGGEDRTVILRDAATGREVRPPFLGHSCWVHGVAFSRDGELLSSASGLGPDSLPAARVASVSGDGNVKLWDVATGREVVTIHGHGSFVRCVAFHPDGSRLVTASADGTIKLWDAASGQEVLALRGHDGGVFGVAFSRDGTLLASAGADGTVRIWDARR